MVALVVLASLCYYHRQHQTHSSLPHSSNAADVRPAAISDSCFNIRHYSPPSAHRSMCVHLCVHIFLYTSMYAQSRTVIVVHRLLERSRGTAPTGSSRRRRRHWKVRGRWNARAITNSTLSNLSRQAILAS